MGERAHTGEGARGLRASSTIFTLQAGRGIAALLVVLMHAALAGKDFGGPFLGHDLLQYGYLGVDFFFVLSGFIIFHSTVGKEKRPRDYAFARFRRIYLPYWPAGVGIAVLYVAFPGLSAAERAWSWLPTLTLAPVAVDTALSAAWTLKHEVLFYVLFGLFYFSRLLPLGLCAWAIAILAGPRILPFAAINLEFFFGIGAAILYRSDRARPAIALLAIPLLGGWIALGALPDQRLLIGGAIACLVAPLAQLERQGRVVGRGPLILLGAASYSIYLVHAPLVSLMTRCFSDPWIIFAAGTAASVAGGFAYHFLVEGRLIERGANPQALARWRRSAG